MKTISKMALLRCGAASAMLGASLMSTLGHAQVADNSAGEAIVVTGSRIARPDLDTGAPLAVVSAEEFKLSGAVNVEQVLNTLPQVLPGTSSFSNNPGGGVATLNLRGLGTNRNLVLVNGRRWMFFDTTQVVDLNTIPQFLIEGVDVVTGGASAVYGSDAIAGVVNFRLRNNLTGIEVGSQYSITEEGDGGRWDTNIAIGTDFADGRGHITAYGEYYKRKSILQGARSFSRFTAQDGAGVLTRTGGSATTPAGRFAVPGTVAIAAGNGLGAVTLNRGAGTTYGSALGATFDSSTSSSRNFVTGPDTFNFAPDNYLQVPQERWLLGAYGDYEINDNVTAYMELAFVNNRVANELAATPVTGNFNVNIAAVSPFLSAADIAAFNQIDANETAIIAARTARVARIAGESDAVYAARAAAQGALFTGANAASNAPGVINLGVSRRVRETGSRNTLDERNAFRALAGVRGAIGDSGFSYDAFYSYARTRNANVQAGNISRRAFQAGLDGTAPAIDIFGPGALSRTSVNQISILAQNNDISTLQVAQASVNGSLFNLGWGGDDIGVEWRSMASRFIPDTALSSGDVIGFNAGNPTQGGYNVKEVFGEIRIPIAADQPFFHKLEVSGAGRYSDYSLDAVGGVSTYAGDIQWAPIRDITFRGSYSRAVRAPNVSELFGGLQTGFPTGTDPCTAPAAAAPGPLRDTCIATGVPAANLGQGVPSQLQPNTQFQSQTGGNPNLQAEKSTSYTFGAIVQPTFLPGLNIKVDYFNIKIGNAIFAAGGGAANILNLCYNTFQNASNGFCQLVGRNDATGAIDGTTNADGSVAVVFAGAANLSSLKTSGIDLDIDYSIGLGKFLLGEDAKLNIAFLGTYTKKNTFVPVNGEPDVVECAGFFGANCGNPQGKYKWTTRLTLVDGPLTSTVRWRHISSTRDDDDTTDYVVEKLKAYNLYDVAFSAAVNDNLTMSFGVNNLLDKKPQLIGSNAEQANTYPSTFDVLGRDFFLSANMRF
ncbi:TonB-dependent receptor [Sphingobium sp. CR2-8]|uniref:TonB-dependent receptor domain-containing protein n=1 Tax=Sphingobium sp. CR2-8 TaxID=1306534 RepID=UPI002DBB9232|nr:TonB-dependent receptor [Sphingobium sp. CR2-8]MEC3912750.1 TonB-dependent receptor [Sphingobium sp. CR2-8]